MKKPKSKIRLRKAKVLEAISRSHLEAIGRVAATWSSLEFSMIAAIAKVSGCETYKAIVLAGPAAFASWADMLVISAQSSSLHKDKADEFASLCKLLLKLLRLRNYIVHAVWEQKSKGIGLIASAMNSIIPGAYDKASGLGFPKRGRDVILKVEWTPQQMRLVASLIEESESILVRIVYRPNSTSLAELSEHMQSRQTIQQRIRKALDSLPEPFQALSKVPKKPSNQNR